jgi:hypothetical protein
MEADHAFLKYAKLWELQNRNGGNPSPDPETAVVNNK